MASFSSTGLGGKTVRPTRPHPLPGKQLLLEVGLTSELDAVVSGPSEGNDPVMSSHPLIFLCPSGLGQEGMFHPAALLSPAWPWIGKELFLLNAWQ